MPLDHYDKTLLYELDRDATISLAALSKKLRRSKPFILHRMKRLEEEGILTGYHALVDMSTLGYFTFRIYIDLHHVTEEDKSKLIQHAKRHPAIWNIALMDGGWDVALFAYVKSIPEFHSVWDDIKLHFKPKIKKYNIALYAPIYHYNRHFFLDSEARKAARKKGMGIERIMSEERILGLGKAAEIDQLDWKILQLHAPSCRDSSIEIAKKAGCSADTVRARIRKLREKKVIVGYSLGMDVRKLGYETFIIYFELQETQHEKELHRYCRMHPAICQINKTIGGGDFEVVAVVKGLERLRQLINEIKTNFKEVQDDEYYSFSSFHAVNYVMG